MERDKQPSRAFRLATWWEYCQNRPQTRWIALLIFLSALSVAVPGLNPQLQDDLPYVYLRILALVGVVYAFLQGLQGLAATERKFWQTLALAFGSRMLAMLVVLFSPELPAAPMLAILSEILFALDYSFQALATELKPHWDRRRQPNDSDVFPAQLGIIFLVFSFALYFVLIPARVDFQTYQTYLPSMYLYLALDIFMGVRYFLLYRSAQDDKWRGIYRLLAIAIFLLTLTDTLDLLFFLEIRLLPPLLEAALWNVPFFALIWAGFLKRSTKTLRDNTEPPTVEEQLNRRSLETMTWALLLPLLHLAGHASGALRGPSESYREVLVVLYIVVFGVIAMTQHRKFHSRNLEFGQQRNRISKALRKSEDNIKLLRERQKTALHLRRAEDDFAKIFRASPSGLMILQLPDGRLLEVNERLEQITGLTEEQLLSGEPKIWADPAAFEQTLSRLRNRGSVQEDLELKQPTGQTLTFSAETLTVEGETWALATVRDHSEWQKGGDLWHLDWFENADHALCLIDRHRHIQQWNGAAERLFGLSATAVIGRPADEFLTEVRDAEQTEKNPHDRVVQDTSYGIVHLNRRWVLVDRNGTWLLMMTEISPTPKVDTSQAL